MSAPAYSDFTIYTGTKLTNTDWNTNLQIIINYLTDGTADCTIGDLVCTSITVGSSVITDLYPIGGIMQYGGATAPSGWLLCQGQAVSRTTYANLYAVIGIVYGAGDTTTTFNLPDLQDKFPIGKSGTKALGTTGGSATIGHSHTVDGHTHTTPNHAHTLSGHTHTVSGTTTGADGTNTQGLSAGGYYNTTMGTHTHNVSFSSQAPSSDTTNTSGSGTSGSTSPGTDTQTLSTLSPYVTTNYIIKY